MTYVVTDNCINCKHTACVEVCPTDAFREGPNFLVIDPQGCVDCHNCVPECPIDAIFEESELPPDQQHFLALNAELAERWPEIIVEKPPLPDHVRWDGVPGKLKLLQHD